MDDLELETKMTNKMPKRWLLLGANSDWVCKTQTYLESLSLADEEHSFLRWRLKYGLLRVADLSSFGDEIDLALRDDVARSALECWTVLNREQWYENAIKCELLVRKENTMLDVNFLVGSTVEQRVAELHRFAMEANKPDLMAEVAWLSSERHLPISPDLLALGPLPEFDSGRNHAMAQEGYRCYSAWASALLEHNDPGELALVWGPYPQEVSGDDGNGHPVSDISDARGRREQARMERRPSYRMEGALAAADSKESKADIPSFAWTPIPGFSHGAFSLQAWVRPPKSAGDKPAIEFVALWDDERATPAKPGDIRLVLMLSRRKPVLLTGRPDVQPAKGSLYSLHFDWPREAWPEDLGEAPPLHLNRKLKAALEKARVSLM